MFCKWRDSVAFQLYVKQPRDSNRCFCRQLENADWVSPHFPSIRVHPWSRVTKLSITRTLTHSVQDLSLPGFEAFVSWLHVVSDEQRTAERWRKAPAWFAFRAIFTVLDENDKLERLRENLIISPLTGLDLIICTSKSPASPVSADYSVPKG